MTSYTVRLVPLPPLLSGPLSIAVQAESLTDALVAAHRAHPGAKLFAAEARDGPYAASVECSADGTRVVLRSDHVCISVDDFSVYIAREFAGVTVDTFYETREGETSLTRARLTHRRGLGRLVDAEGEFAQTPIELAEWLWSRLDLSYHFRDLEAGAWAITRAPASTIFKRHVQAVQHGGGERRLEFVVWVNDAGRPLREAYLVDAHTGHRLLGVESDFQREDAHSLAERAYRNFDFAKDHGDVEADGAFEVYTDGGMTILTKPVFIRPRQHSDAIESCSQRIGFEVYVYLGLVVRVAATGSEG